MKTIVISAVNIVEAGTLVILRDCLHYLSQLAVDGHYRVVAVVYDQNLAKYPHVEYIETQWPKKRWINRLWYEYVSMKKVSKEIGSVYLWFSLHDVSPNIKAERRAVYCHNPFPFYTWKWRELLFAPKIVLFALFSKFIYRKNIYDNDFIVVQQLWIREAFRKMFELESDKIIVSLPANPMLNCDFGKDTSNDEYQFIYAASPNSHKNFECLCEAASLLERNGVSGFKVLITVTGNENRYAQWLFKKWGNKVNALKWIGFQKRDDLFRLYGESNCLVFPSKAETWGLPISEFANYEKPMLLADKPYARETAAGSKYTAFFHPDRPDWLAEHMKRLIEGKRSSLAQVDRINIKQPVVNEWRTLFDLLLNKHHEDITGR
ncbi:glycosyltransferase [Sphingobacterium faecale]|uniref:Glycosyltransferase n=1 Tax=Sphingobacterium faecale TaxID=2803775 RepID=A0ABS1QZ31_9SPHI|nr:glycosyltransferase [Sphingobacterium faecale]MBL1407274.1 glycosyltransferase [Sphingobacterium faecale]